MGLFTYILIFVAFIIIGYLVAIWGMKLGNDSEPDMAGLLIGYAFVAIGGLGVFLTLAYAVLSYFGVA